MGMRLTEVAIEFKDTARVASWLWDVASLTQGLHSESCEEPELSFEDQLLVRLFAGRLLPIFSKSLENDLWTGSLHASDEPLESGQFQGTAVSNGDLVDDRDWRQLHLLGNHAGRERLPL